MSEWYEMTTWASIGDKRTTIYKFYVEIVRGDESTFVKVGSSTDTPCVHIQVAHDYDFAELMLLQHRDDCSSNEPLKRGINGTVLMLYAALHVVNDLFPQLTQMEFTDNAQVHCEAIGKDLELSTFKFITEGHTWYQKVLPISLKHPFYQEKLLEAQEHLNSRPPLKWRDIDWKLRGHFDQPAYSSMIKEVRRVYESAPSLKEVFRQWYLLFGCPFFVSEMASIINTFGLISLQNMHWIINMKSALVWSKNQHVELVQIDPPEGINLTRKRIQILIGGMQPYYWTESWKVNDHKCGRGALN